MLNWDYSRKRSCLVAGHASTEKPGVKETKKDSVYGGLSCLNLSSLNSVCLASEKILAEGCDGDYSKDKNNRERSSV